MKKIASFCLIRAQRFRKTIKRLASCCNKTSSSSSMAFVCALHNDRIKRGQWSCFATAVAAGHGNDLSCRAFVCADWPTPIDTHFLAPIKSTGRANGFEKKIQSTKQVGVFLMHFYLSFFSTLYTSVVSYVGM